MAFPTNPTNGQQTTINGIIYTYDSTLAAWTATTTTSDNISGNNITITNQMSSTTIAATGTISAVGNITGGNIVTAGYFVGNGSLLTGLPASYGNSNVSTLLAAFGSNTVSTTGNVTAGNFLSGVTNNSLIISYDTVGGNANIGANSTGGSTSLYFGTSNAGTFTNKIQINNLGNLLPTANATQDLGSTTLRWKSIYTSDLDLNNGIGDWTIVEGEEDLFLYNNKRGKTYKFALIEVDPLTAPPKINNLKK